MSDYEHVEVDEMRFEGLQLQQPSAEDAMDVDEDEWQVVPMDNLDLSDEQDEATDDPEWCFFCTVSHATGEDTAGSHNYNAIKKLIGEQYHLMNLRALVREVQTFYNSEIRSNLIQHNKVWTKQTILNHIIGHAPTQHIQYEMSLRTHNEVMTVLRQHSIFLQRRTSGKRNIDAKSYDLYIKAEKQRNSLLSKVEDLRKSYVC